MTGRVNTDLSAYELQRDSACSHRPVFTVMHRPIPKPDSSGYHRQQQAVTTRSSCLLYQRTGSCRIGGCHTTQSNTPKIYPFLAITQSQTQIPPTDPCPSSMKVQELRRGPQKVTCRMHKQQHWLKNTEMKLWL